VPTDLTPSANLNATVTVPNAGEARTAASVRAPIQALLDRVGAITDSALFTLHDSRRELNVQRGGTRTNFDIDIGAISAIVIHDGSGNDYVHAYGGGTAAVTEANVGGGDLGAVAKPWYIYAWRNAGNLAWEVSDVAPNASRTLKSTDNTRSYFGTFIADSAGAPVAARAVGGCCRYRDRAAASFLHQNQTTANLNTFTSALSLADLVPPHARIALIRLQLNRTGSGGDAAASVRVNGDTNPAATVVAPGLPLLHPADHFIEMDVGNSREVQVSTNGASTLVNVDVAGWRE